MRVCNSDLSSLIFKPVYAYLCNMQYNATFTKIWWKLHELVSGYKQVRILNNIQSRLDISSLQAPEGCSPLPPPPTNQSPILPYNLIFLWYILRTARGFWKYCKKGGGGGFLALKSHTIYSTKRSCLETKADIVCFSLNSVFLFDPKNDDCAEEKDAHRLLFFFFLFFAIWSPIFYSFSSLSLFLSSPLYHASFAPSHLGYAHLI